MKESVIATICSHIGVECLQHVRLHSGDINEAYRIKTSQGALFLKLNDAKAFPKLFQREAEGLEALQNASSLKVPEIIHYGEYADKQFLVLKFINKAAPVNNFWLEFAYGLAAVHRNTNVHFGWKNDNYLGLVQQNNTYHDKWSSFYANERLSPLIKQLFDRGDFLDTDLKRAEWVCTKLGDICPEEKPALLHGDLWGGNFMVNADGYAVVYDPAVYYGHREMDISMTRLFGGFSTEFYRYYNEAFPLQKGWQQRLSLMQLYPLLVHAVLFGGSYIHTCRNIIKEWS